MLVQKSIEIANNHLKKSDPVMRELIGLGEIFNWHQQSRQFPYFHILTRLIIDQQLSLKAAETIAKRVLHAHGGRSFNARRMVQMSVSELRNCGLSQNKIRYVLALSQQVNDGVIDFKKLKKDTDKQVKDCLMQVPGIGQWSSDLFLMFALHREDVFPVNDLIIRKTIQRYYQLPENATFNNYCMIAENWRPYRSVASRYLWAAPRQ